MTTDDRDRIRIELWGAEAPAFGLSGQVPRGVLAGDFDIDMTPRYNKNGVAFVTIADDNPYVSEIVKRDTNAVVFFDDVAIYSGHIEEQEIPLVPGGEIEFSIVDAWEMFLGGSLAWVNPTAVGQAEVRDASNNLIRRVSPWTTGSLRPSSQYDLGQCGLRTNLPIYPDPFVAFSANGETTDLVLRLFPGGLESMGQSADWMRASFTGYWNPAHRSNTGTLEERSHREGSWLQHLILSNLLTRLGYHRMLDPITTWSNLGKLIWYPQTSVGDQVESDPETWRYGPLLRFDNIEDAVEDFLDGVADNAIRAAMRWNWTTRRWTFVVDEPTDLSTRVLTFEGGEIAGGKAKLSKMPATDVVVAGPGDFDRRAMDATKDGSRANRFGWRREVFESASNATPVWEDNGGYNTPEVFRIPKYHHQVGNLSQSTRDAFRAQMQQAGIARLSEDRPLDGVNPILQESEWFKYTPGSTDGYDLGTRVAIDVPGVGILHERIRSIRITLNAQDGLIVTPQIGDPAQDRDLSAPLARTAKSLGRMERSR